MIKPRGVGLIANKSSFCAATSAACVGQNQAVRSQQQNEEIQPNKEQTCALHVFFYTFSTLFFHFSSNLLLCSFQRARLFSVGCE